MQRTHDRARGLFVLFFACTVLFIPLFAIGQTEDELQKQISDYNKQIVDIEKEIAKYEQQLDTVGTEKKTLENAILELDISRQKISAKINAARNRIYSTELEISEIDKEILTKKESMDKGAGALAETIRRIDEVESQALVEILLQSEKVSALWEDVDSAQRFQTVVRERLADLAQAKIELEEVREISENKHEQLVQERDDYAAQQQALQVAKREKNSLLSQTKEKESNYQQILSEKKAAREEFESALLELESQLEYTRDPSRIPPVGEGVLRWPLDSVTITQHFGNTEFANSGAYNGKGHNGVDFRASVGTPVKSALSGTVEATGNTDQHAGCYSYGKWVLIRHSNGLSTLYAHLSHIAVQKGESVSTGHVIGYSGNTGYSTGPHLHFTVYESAFVKIVRLGDVKSRTNCANALIPVAPLEAYLNPLDYL